VNWRACRGAGGGGGGGGGGVKRVSLNTYEYSSQRVEFQLRAEVAAAWCRLCVECVSRGVWLWGWSRGEGFDGGRRVVRWAGRQAGRPPFVCNISHGAYIIIRQRRARAPKAEPVRLSSADTVKADIL
jgi:hypothetical protein